jgi:hypothetical protein
MMQLNVSHCKVVAMPADLLSIARLWTAQAAMNNGLAIECDRERCNEKSYAIYFCPLPTAASCIAYATHEKKRRKKRSEKRGDGEREVAVCCSSCRHFFFISKSIILPFVGWTGRRHEPHRSKLMRNRVAKPQKDSFLMPGCGPEKLRKALDD